MVKRASKILVGDLLVKSEMVTLSQFADAMPVSLKTGLPVGRVLIASGFLSEGKFKTVLTVQSLIRDHLLSDDTGIEALRLVATEEVELAQALDQLGETCDYFAATNRLGEILVDAQVVSREMLDETLAVSLMTGLPLARVLAMRGFIEEPVAFISLCSQTLLRDGKLDRDSVIAAIKLVGQNVERLAKLKVNPHPWAISLRRANSLRLGELLLLSGMVKDQQLVDAVDKGMTDEQPLGKVLTRVGLITESQLGQALAIQEMVNNRTLSPDDATFVLSSVKNSNISLSKALLESEKLKSEKGDKAARDKKSDKANEKIESEPLDAFLLFLGLADKSELVALKGEVSKSGNTLREIVLAAKIIDPLLEKAVLDCFDLYRDGRLEDDQCAFAIHVLAASGQGDLPELLKQLSW